MVHENTYEAWEMLNLKWSKSNFDALGNVDEEFWDCNLMSDTKDASQWKTN
jgi:hypothetical protein